MAKTTCPITREQFAAKAPRLVLPVRMHGSSDDLARLESMPREFSTSSLGWGFNGRISVEIDGKLCDVQVGLNMTIIGSKELPTAKPEAK